MPVRNKSPKKTLPRMPQRSASAVRTRAKAEQTEGAAPAAPSNSELAKRAKTKKRKT
jgi:hypothetical protein